MRPKQRAWHKLLFKEIVKAGTIGLASGFINALKLPFNFHNYYWPLLPKIEHDIVQKNIEKHTLFYEENIAQNCIMINYCAHHRKQNCVFFLSIPV